MMRIITRHFWWKLGSLALSFILWIAMNGANDLNASVSVPVQFRNIPQNLEISSELAEQVHLFLRGPSLLLSRAAANPSPVVLDLSTATGPGEKSFLITSANVRLPGGVTLEKAVPSQIRLRLERRLKKDVAIVVRTVHVPDGYRAVLEETSPPMLTIAGPETRVQAIDSVETDPIDLHTLDSSGRARTYAYTGDPRVTFSSTPAVAVRFSIVPMHGK